MQYLHIVIMAVGLILLLCVFSRNERIYVFTSIRIQKLYFQHHSKYEHQILFKSKFLLCDWAKPYVIQQKIQRHVNYYETN